MRYALVIKDKFSDYIWFYVQPGKTQDEFLQALKAFSRMIRARYDVHIYRIHRDNKKSLGKQWDDRIRRKGIMLLGLDGTAQWTRVLLNSAMTCCPMLRRRRSQAGQARFRGNRLKSTLSALGCGL